MLREMFDYLTGGVYKGTFDACSNTLAVVFGRKDLKLARRTAELYHQAAFRWIIPTGGVGKDSGDLTVPEATYLASEMIRQGVDQSAIFPETEARNGGENARFSLQKAIEQNLLPISSTIVAIIHSTSARRLAATLDHEARKLGWHGTILTVTSGYQPDFSNPKDQKEIMGEMIRMVDQAAEGFLTLDPALFSDDPNKRDGRLLELVAYARANIAA